VRIQVLVTRDPHQLPPDLSDLPGCLSMNADFLTGFERETMMRGVLPGSHKEEEVGLVLLAKQVIPPIGNSASRAADKDAPRLGEGGGEGNSRNAAVLICCQEHPAEARMHGKREHAPSERRNRTGC